MIFRVIFYVIFLFPILCQSTESSKELDDFYQEEKVILSIVLAVDKSKMFTVDASVFGDRIIAKKISLTELQGKLNKSLGISKDISYQIGESLKKGITSSYDCKGFRNECGLLPDKYDFVFYPEELKLYLHVNSKYLISTSKRKKDIYIKDNISEKAVISEHSVNISTNASDINNKISSRNQFNYQNSSTYSLGKMGFLYSDISIDSNKGVSSRDISSNYLEEEQKISLGYKLSDNSWNRTSFLDNDLISGYMFQLGSSDSLKKSQKSNRRLYFNVSRNGRLEVTDDFGRFLISKNVNIGQDYISYSDLPEGKYNINVRVYDGSGDIYNQNYIINNNNNNNNYSGKMDYMISSGFLSDSLNNRKGNNAELYKNYDYPFFINGRLAVALNDNITLGGGILTTINEYYSYLGADLSFDNNNLSFTLGKFDNNNLYYTADLYLDGLSISYEKYDSKNSNNLINNLNLSDIVGFGGGARESLSLNYNYYYGSMSYIASVIMNNNVFKVADNSKTNESENTTIRNALFFSGLPFDINLNIEHDFIINNNDNEQAIFVNATVPLSKKNVLTHSSGGNIRDLDDFRHQSVLSSNIISDDDTSLNTSIGAQYKLDNSDENLYDLSLSGSYNNEYINTNIYSYVNSDGSASLSGHLSTNSILTNGDVLFTKDKAQSYFIGINETGEFNEDRSFLAVIDSEVNDKPSQAYSIAKKIKAYPLQNYKEYKFKLDTSASDFYNMGDKVKEGSSYPGTVIKLTTALGEVKSFITTFSDIEGMPVKDVECIGNGCVSSDELAEGVYQFRVKPELNYKIISKNNQCVIPRLDSSKNMNLGDNFCMPIFEDNDDGYQISYDYDGKIYYYIGKFLDKEIIDKYKEKLQLENIDIVTRGVDSYTYLFLKSDSLLAGNSKYFVEELMSYAIQENSIPYVSIKE
ncbi:CS1-pili formation C-terminal domain-containing protein [Photobacterium damselae]|uniref:CS1-pili formation C-terminal domain-containing protein n=1 Tax=Photobacterium damselae TaxID=38293 RepID=UPI0035A872CE